MERGCSRAGKIVGITGGRTLIVKVEGTAMDGTGTISVCVGESVY